MFLPIHAPAEQVSVALQALPQLPQLAGSVLGLTHEPPQLMSPLTQQRPLEHALSVLQTVPQAPQLLGSAPVSLQTPEQSI